MSSVLLAVVTSPRPNVSYLSLTLKLLDLASAGACDRKLVMSDGPLDESEVPADWHAVVMPGPSGSRIATWRVFEAAARANFDRLLIVQDDITPCKNAIPQMIATEIPREMAFISFFDIHIMPRGTPPGIYGASVRRNGKIKDFCGAQCILMPMRTVSYLAQQDPFSMPDESYWHPQNSCDPVMGYLLDRSPWRSYGVHIPCLVEHRGDESIAHPHKKPGQTRASNFAGEEFDALTLGKLPFKPSRPLS